MEDKPTPSHTKRAPNTRRRWYRLVETRGTTGTGYERSKGHRARETHYRSKTTVYVRPLAEDQS